jgi:hypothetical protein
MNLVDVFQSIKAKLSFSKVVEIAGIKFELSLLSFEQETKTDYMPQDDVDPVAFFNENRLRTLSYAVKSVNGEVISDVVELVVDGKPEKIQGSLFVKDLLSKLPVKLIEQLFDVYVDLKEQTDASLEKDLKYNWFKTPEKREEERKNKRGGKEPESSETAGEAPEEAPEEDKPIEYKVIPSTVEDETPNV